jgi:hypothetical protein
MAHNATDHECFEKARRRGDFTFTLVGQDQSSPAVIIEWIKQNIETAPAEKLRCALEDALLMRENPQRKTAD